MTKARIRANQAQTNCVSVRPPRHESIRQQAPGMIQQVAPEVAYRCSQADRIGLKPAHLLALQRTVGNRMVQRATAQHKVAADDIGTGREDYVQRAVLLPAHDYGPGIPGEPQVQTSINFDTNHLIIGQTTEEIARKRRQDRGNPVRNTVVSLDALKREVTNNDLDLIRSANTEAITTYNFNNADEARTASDAGVLWARTIGVKAHRAGDAIEIYHVHESEQALSAEDFPPLGSAPAGRGKKTK